MAKIIKISSGGRGRPLEIDVEKTLEQFMSQLSSAKERLRDIRQRTRGERSEALLGSETTLPKGIVSTKYVLDALKEGQSISYQTAKELRSNLKLVKELSSKQERVYSRALAESFEKQYISELEYTSRNASAKAKEFLGQMKSNIKKLSPRQQQQYFTSRAYQSPKTARGTYERARLWSEKDIKKKTGKEITLTGEEGLLYVNLDKQQDYIEQEFFIEELPF